MLRPIILPLALVALLQLPTHAFAQGTESQEDSIAEIALSEEALQLRYIDEGEYFGMDGSRLTGTFFLSEARDVVLSAGLQLPADIDSDP